MFKVSQLTGFSINRRKMLQVTACATSDTALPHDTLLEGFGAPGYEVSGWTESIGAGGSIDDTADSSSLTTNKPTGACDTALRVISSGAVTYAQWDSGSARIYNFDFYFHIYFSTITVASGGTYVIFTVNNSSLNPAGTVRVQVRLRNTAGTLTIEAQGDTSSSTTTVTTGQWYKVKIHLDATAASSYIQVNDGAQNSFTRGTGGANWRYMEVGGTRDVGAGEVLDAYYDVIAIENLA